MSLIDLMSFPEKVKFEISKGDLMAFAEALLIGSKTSSPIDDNEKFIGLEEVKEMTGLAKQTIYGRVSKGTIPYYKTEDGKRLRFKKSEIIEWMKSGKKKTEAEIQKEVNTYLINKTKTLSQKNR